MVEQGIYDAVVTENQVLAQQVCSLTESVNYLNERLEQLTRMLLGQSSERFVSDQTVIDADATEQQLGLFGEVKAEQPTQTTEVPAHKRTSRQKHPRPGTIPAHLPRKVEIIEPEGQVF